MALPGLATTGRGVVVAVALVEATGLLAGGGEATGLAVLENRDILATHPRKKSSASSRGKQHTL